MAKKLIETRGREINTSEETINTSEIGNRKKKKEKKTHRFSVLAASGVGRGRWRVPAESNAGPRPTYQNHSRRRRRRRPRVSVSSRTVRKNVARNKDQLISPSGVGVGPGGIMNSAAAATVPHAVPSGPPPAPTRTPDGRYTRAHIHAARAARASIDFRFIVPLARARAALLTHYYITNYTPSSTRLHCAL